LNILVGITAYGSAKDYCMPQFQRMFDECVRPLGADVCWATDLPPEEASERYDGDVFVQLPPGLSFSEDILIPAHEAFRTLALEDDYDVLMWQNVDAFWDSVFDVYKVLSHLGDVPIVAPLICARTDSMYPIARRFDFKPSLGEDGEHRWLEEQYEIPSTELRSGELVSAGMAGSDTIFFRKDAIDWGDAEHTPWYERVEHGNTNICFEEFILLELARRGKRSFLDTGVDVWHVHSDMVARKWPGIEVPLEELGWG
jgi:hypothetical protein